MTSGRENATASLPPSPLTPQQEGASALGLPLGWMAILLTFPAWLGADTFSLFLYPHLNDRPLTFFNDPLKTASMVAAAAAMDRIAERWPRAVRWAVGMAAGALVSEDALLNFDRFHNLGWSIWPCLAGLPLIGLGGALAGALLAVASLWRGGSPWQLVVVGMGMESTWIVVSAVVTYAEKLLFGPHYTGLGFLPWYDFTLLNWLTGCVYGSLFGGMIAFSLVWARAKQAGHLRVRDGRPRRAGKP